MKSIITVVSLLIIESIIISCSTNEYNPDDYYQSWLSGEYGKDSLWNLVTIINGDTVNNGGYVRFDSKDLEKADLRFVNVIPGKTYQEFKDVQLTDMDNGLSFTIDYIRKANNVHIIGIVRFGEMTVDMTMSE